MFNTANSNAGVAVKNLSGREKLSASRDFYRLYYPLCVSRRIDTWQILYYRIRIPVTVLQYQFIKVRIKYINVPIDAHGQLPVAGWFR